MLQETDKEIFWQTRRFQCIIGSPMTLFLNGESREIPSVRTVPELVATLGLPSGALLIEHNGLALLRDEWVERPIAEGDRIEFLRITAGG